MMKKICNKKGIGIAEVLVAAVVLGFMYMAVLNLQSGNRDALLRIRGRDGATEVAQNIIDSLSSLGIAALSEEKLGIEDNQIKPIKIDGITRTWKGQPGIQDHDMTVTYNAVVNVSRDAEFQTQYASSYTEASESHHDIQHLYAKRLDVNVSWRFKNSTQSITVSGVVR